MELHKHSWKLAPGTAYIWFADLPTWRDRVPVLKEFLSPAEIQRLERLKFEEKKREFIISRGLLRLILSQYKKQDPERLTISRTDSGKPFLEESKIQFSVSHSNEKFGFALHSTHKIGLDIQEIYPISSLDRVINNFFSDKEIDHLNSISDDHLLQDRFFAIWTAKEAYLKATGVGIEESFKRLSILPESEGFQIFSLDDPDQQEWNLRSLDLAEGYRVVVAIEGEISEMIQSVISPEDFPDIWEGI